MHKNNPFSYLKILPKSTNQIFHILIPFSSVTSISVIGLLEKPDLKILILIILFVVVSFALNKSKEKIFEIFNNKLNINKYYEDKLFIAEINEDPISYSYKVFTYFLFCLACSIFCIFIIIYFSLYFILIVLLIPSFIYLTYLVLYPIIKSYEINSGIEKEIQMLYALISSFITIGVNPYLTLFIASRIPFFKYFRKIFNQIEKIRVLYMLNPIDAISKYSRLVQNEQLKSMLQTFSSSESVELHKIFKNMMIDSFKLLEKKIENLLDKFNIILASQLLVFILVPITMVVTAIFTGLEIGLALIVFIFVPFLFFIVFFIMLRSSIPTYLSLQISIDYKKSILIFLPISLLLFLLNFERIISLNVMIFLYFLSFLSSIFYFNYKKQRIYENLINSIPKLFREISEETKKGTSPILALNKIFERVEDIVKIFIKKLIFSKKFGLSITHVLSKENLPLMFKQLFSLLEYTEQAGADPLIYSDLSDFVEKLDNSRRVFKVRTRFFKYSSYFVSGLMGISISISISILGNLVNALSSTEAIYMFSSILSPTATPSWIYLIASLSAYINSIMLGYLGGSLGHDHVEGFKNAIICLVIVFLILQVSNLFGLNLLSYGKLY